MNALFHCFDSNTLNLRERLKLQTTSRRVMFVYSITLKKKKYIILCSLTFLTLHAGFWLWIKLRDQGSLSVQLRGQHVRGLSSSLAGFSVVMPHHYIQRSKQLLCRATCWRLHTSNYCNTFNDLMYNRFITFKLFKIIYSKVFFLDLEKNVPWKW